MLTTEFENGRLAYEVSGNDRGPVLLFANSLWSNLHMWDPAGYAACCAVLRDTDLRSEIKNIPAASLIITGMHDPATPRADGLAVHAAIPNSKYVELNASHLSAWECAGEFATAVLEHLTAGEENHG